MLSFLPMAHMFERVMQTTVMLKGGRIGFFRGDIQLLIDDIQALKPSVMPVVPRVLNRLYHDVSFFNKLSLWNPISRINWGILQGVLQKTAI
jgi:long-subunit acyl-CoA synthetase (AMP-forming)